MNNYGTSERPYILHSDGNYFTKAKKSGFGGYIQDADGTTLVEYTEQIREPKYEFCYEILGLIRGLHLAHSMNIKHLVSYGDDKTLMETISALSKQQKVTGRSPADLENLPNHGRLELFIEALELASQFETFDCHYIPREENKYSDSLSRRYSLFMQKSYIEQYMDDLRRSEQNLEKGIRPKRRQFFSAPTLIKMHEKNNPFLVAPTRNRPLRVRSRAEFQKPYQFLFMEVETNDFEKILRVFYYKDKNETKTPVVIDTHTFEKDDFDICKYLEVLNKNLATLDHSRPIWIHGNVVEYSAMLEQKEKIPRDDTTFSYFVETYKEMSKYPSVWCHHFTFPHKFSDEIVLKKNREIEMRDQEIETMEELFEIFINSKLSDKERNKIFGKMFRYHIKENEEILGRSLEDNEKVQYRAEFQQKLASFILQRTKDLKDEEIKSYNDEEKQLSRKPRM